jgi:hypothetical protein
MQNELERDPEPHGEKRHDHDDDSSRDDPFTHLIPNVTTLDEQAPKSLKILDEEDNE